MKKFFAVVFTLTMLVACKNEDNKKDANATQTKEPTAKMDSLLITDSSWGRIKKSDDFAALKGTFGNNIIDKRICGPECIDSIDVSIIYPDAVNESIVYWKDSAYHKVISFIECYNDSSKYYTSSGIKIGSGLPELLKLNGKRINFYGFDWDYGGGIISYNNGALEKSPIHYDLGLKGEDRGLDLLGDTEFHSDMPAVKKAIDNIYVRKLSLSFMRE
jgi:hypothetical protein